MLLGKVKEKSNTSGTRFWERARKVVLLKKASYVVYWRYKISSVLVTLMFQNAMCGIFKDRLANTLSAKPSLMFWAHNTDPHCDSDESQEQTLLQKGTISCDVLIFLFSFQIEGQLPIHL